MQEAVPQWHECIRIQLIKRPDALRTVSCCDTLDDLAYNIYKCSPLPFRLQLMPAKFFRGLCLAVSVERMSAITAHVTDEFTRSTNLWKI